MLSHGILPDVDDMHTVVILVANPMIGKPSLPDFQVRAKLLFRPIRKSAFDELHCFLEAGKRRDEYVQMIGHDNEFMEQISRFPIVTERID